MRPTAFDKAPVVKYIYDVYQGFIRFDKTFKAWSWSKKLECFMGIILVYMWIGLIIMRHGIKNVPSKGKCQ